MQEPATQRQRKSAPRGSQSGRSLELAVSPVEAAESDVVEEVRPDAVGHRLDPDRLARERPAQEAWASAGLDGAAPRNLLDPTCPGESGYGGLSGIGRGDGASSCGGHAAREHVAGSLLVERSPPVVEAAFLRGHGRLGRPCALGL